MSSPRDVRLRLRYVPEEGVLPIRRPGPVLTVLLVVWAALLWFPLTPLSHSTAPDARPAPVVGAALPTPSLPQPWPQSVQTEAARTVDARFAPGSTLDATLRRAGLHGSELTAVLTAARDAIDVRRIRPGQQYGLYFDADDEFTGFRYQLDRQTAWFVARREGTWSAARVDIPVRTHSTFISAEIVDSLHRALAAYAPTRSAANDLVLKVGDIYGWDVDFQYDLRYGDRLDLVVQERYVEGEFIGYGDVLAAEFHVHGRVLPVVRFHGADDSTSYFNPQGESLRRAFLRSPVKYSRISSRFSMRRVHPVTGIARAHRGVDYAASPGTPVQATADGVVTEARYAAEPGRYVRLRHGGSYSSVYMHMSRFAPGIKPGVEVKQGDILGYVGKTGNATGYHLHYGLEQGDRYVDPLRLQFPAADPVPESDWERFVAQRDDELGALRTGQADRTAAVAGAGAGL